jgi:acetyl-CoA C-acetyltransferase
VIPPGQRSTCRCRSVAVRSPFGRRNGQLSELHSIDLLGTVQRALFDRTSIDPGIVRQVIGGCIGQVGMRAMNVTRNAWLAAGLPLEVPATSVDVQCGSSQRALILANGLLGSGAVDVALAGGVELMTKVPIGSTIPTEPEVGRAVNRTYREGYELASQLEGAERIADRWGMVATNCDQFGMRSQDLAAAAWSASRFN